MTTIYSRAYLLTKVLTASNREVILYLYEGAQGFLKRAAESRKAGDEAACGESIDRVISILIELSSCLDYNKNGSLALRLDSIYNYMIEALTHSSKDQEMEPVETCQSILVILSDAWRQAIATEKSVDAEPYHLQLRASA